MQFTNKLKICYKNWACWIFKGIPVISCTFKALTLFEQFVSEVLFIDVIIINYVGNHHSYRLSPSRMSFLTSSTHPFSLSLVASGSPLSILLWDALSHATRMPWPPNFSSHRWTNDFWLSWHIPQFLVSPFLLSVSS